MMDWKKLLSKRSLLGFSVIAFGQVISFICGKLLDSGSPSVFVIIGIILSVFCSVGGLIILVTDSSLTAHIPRIMWFFLVLAFVFGVVVGIYHVFN